MSTGVCGSAIDSRVPGGDGSISGQSDMIALAEGVWTETGPARILGMRLTTTMTLLTLRDGSVLVHSPLPLTPERQAEVEAVGAIAHLYAPSTYHDVHIAAWAEAYPEAAILLTGAADPTSRAHGPNESLHLEDWRKSMVAQAIALRLLGES